MDPQTFSSIVDAVKTLGFPAAVAGFVLWRLDRSMRDLTSEIRRFNQTMVAVTENLEKHVTERADFVVREVDHNLRASMGAFRK